MVSHFGRRLARRHFAPNHAAVARGRSVDMDEIGDRRRDRWVEPRAVEHRVGAARCRRRPFRGPPVARPNQAQIAERAIQHRPRRGTDILAELRLDEDDRRPAAHRAASMIGSGHLMRVSSRIFQSASATPSCSKIGRQSGCIRMSPRDIAAGVLPARSPILRYTPEFRKRSAARASVMSARLGSDLF